MKGHRHLAWNVLAALLAAACIVTCVAWAVSYPREIKAEFSHGRKQWEVACRSGVLWLDNLRQQRLGLDQFNSRTADLQRRLHEAWGSRPWQRRVEEMHRLEQEQARVGTAPSEFKIQLLTVAAVAALVPTLWLAIWLFRDPAKRRERLRTAALFPAGFSLLICAMIAFLWMRSFFATDRIVAPTPWRLNRIVLSHNGILIHTFGAVRRQQTWQQPRSTFSGGTAVRPQPVLIHEGADTPIPFEETAYARNLQSTKNTPNRSKWGKWEWETFHPNEVTYSRLAFWAGFRPALYPHIERQSSEDSGYTAEGSANKETYVVQELLFVGHVLWLPCWVLVVVTLMWPVLVAPTVVKHARMKRWQRSNRCCRCGYDLRASQGICPECEKAIPHKQMPVDVGGAHA